MKVLIKLNKKYSDTHPAKFYLNQYAKEKYGKTNPHKMTIQLEKELFKKHTNIDLDDYLEKHTMESVKQK